MRREPAKIAAFIVDPVPVDAMRPSLYAPLSLIVCTALALSACKPADTQPAPHAQDATATATANVDASAAASKAATSSTTAPAGDDNLNAVLWMQRSEEYRAVAEQTYRAAADKLDNALKQPNWDALVPEERGNAATGLKPAVVLDVDETVLDNSPYQARLLRDGKEYDELSWDQWVAEKKATAIPGVVDFAKAANARGITLIYISNRAVHLKDATLANLRSVGLPVADDSVFLGLGTVVPGCEQNGSEKNCRRQLAGQKYRVLMQFGDQLGDFVQVTANTGQARGALLQQYHDWFGERWWMLPNPSYGGWEPAQFNNDYAQPWQTRHDAKRAALEVAR
ncbi:5'-nucleotidase, lipoprotein e(P4) family [Xanthomonas citri pv. citri]|uniref:5'-nucleotidase n=2 Tax=Xanthomonas citri TaxID=346 RepID=A0A0U5FQ33_XANCI|nr:5'-nucleotidase, lipoprotein e(P4) family [Xanthomonas citri]AGH79695.1 acid phosphatase [Xanthomonas axonopodis Xac29-1]AJD70853.1 putative secreted acid phosphatase [Xanthomonas citri subsp. citri A306]AJY88763.1 5'-nucleotidase, lipoprotein e(P4) family [Xanthomonas citri subsp. citri UI6]UVG58850.1 5'-nucleotidase, lipoprotein e(P4) family [Xanthomonas citri pv. durantae]AJY84339.1 5'-nucleotidase, lipoprotein e(P4) family [Xanthomonas citri pv. citri]